MNRPDWQDELRAADLLKSADRDTLVRLIALGLAVEDEPTLARTGQDVDVKRALREIEDAAERADDASRAAEDAASVLRSLIEERERVAVRP